MTKRILFINPNVTDAITETMAGEAIRSVSDGFEIVPVTAAFGTQYIENRVEAAIAGHAVIDVLAKHSAEMDGVIISAFGDPGLWAAKEMLEIPVVGISEAAFHFAMMLGRRYSIVCLTERIGVWYRECAEEHGLDGRLVSVRPLEKDLQDITNAVEEAGDALVELCERAVAEDSADVVIFGGGPVAGLAREVEDRMPVPVLDGVTSAVRLIEAMIALNPRPARAGSFKRPNAKPSSGLSPELTAWVEHREKEQ